MEQMILDSYNMPGFTITDDQTAALHMHTKDLPQETIDSNSLATTVNFAHKSLMSKFSLNKVQFKLCLKNQSIALNSNMCKPIVSTCIFNQTR